MGKIENETVDMEAALEASADSVVQDESESLKNINEKLPYVVKLSKTYNFEGEEISEVDLGGIKDLSTKDAEYVEKVMGKLNYRPNDKFRDTIYVKHIMMRATGLPVEFFNSLTWKDMNALVSRVTVYFLL